MNDDLTLADLVGLDETLRKIVPSWLEEAPFLADEARENGRAKHIAEVLSKIKYKRCKLRWIIGAIKPNLSEPWYGITAQTTVMNEDGSGFLDLLMESVD